MKPEQALNIYLEHRSGEVTDETLQSHEYRLNHFLRWCAANDINDTDEVSPKDLHEYRIWRREDGDLSPASEKGQMDTLRVFIRYLERIDEVKPDLQNAVVSPVLSDEEKRSEDIVDPEVAREIIEYLGTYQYASSRHVAFLLMWHTAMRTSAVHCLDLDDFDAEEMYIEIVNRPDKGTRLKNGDAGERYIALSQEVCEILTAYIEEQRYDVLDDSGREPLITTRHGRVAKNTLRNWSYYLTQPCMLGGCPHDRDVEDCQAAKDTTYPAQCPSSVAPHAIRRGSITAMLREDTPTPVISDRANVSETVLDEHYDKRTDREKMQQRRRHLPDF